GRHRRAEPRGFWTARSPPPRARLAIRRLARRGGGDAVPRGPASLRVAAAADRGGGRPPLVRGPAGGSAGGAVGGVAVPEFGRRLLGSPAPRPDGSGRLRRRRAVPDRGRVVGRGCRPPGRPAP